MTTKSKLATGANILQFKANAAPKSKYFLGKKVFYFQAGKMHVIESVHGGFLKLQGAKSPVHVDHVLPLNGPYYFQRVLIKSVADLKRFWEDIPDELGDQMPISITSKYCEENDFQIVQLDKRSDECLFEQCFGNYKANEVKSLAHIKEFFMHIVQIEKVEIVGADNLYFISKNDEKIKYFISMKIFINKECAYLEFDEKLVSDPIHWNRKVTPYESIIKRYFKVNPDKEKLLVNNAKLIRSELGKYNLVALSPGSCFALKQLENFLLDCFNTKPMPWMKKPVVISKLLFEEYECFFINFMDITISKGINQTFVEHPLG